MARKAWTSTEEHLIRLRRNLTDYFSEDELRTLCTDLGIPYESLRGQGQAARSRALVKYLNDRGRIPELMALGSRLRPNVSWGEVPAGDEAGSAAHTPTLIGYLLILVVLVAALVALFTLRRSAGPGPLAVPTRVALVANTPTPRATPANIAFTATPMSPATPEIATPSSTPPISETRTPSATAEPGPSASPAAVLPPISSPQPSPTSPFSRGVLLLAPAIGACQQSPMITFKWTSTALRPGEAFLVLIAPSEVNKNRCTTNYPQEGVQTSPPLTGHEWTVDISHPPSPVLAACAGEIQWTVYIRDAAGNITRAAPTQSFIWNPFACKPK